MGWVYLDDQFPDHPKVAAAGGDAAWLFVCGLAYCRRFNTDGLIPRGQVPKLTDRKNPGRLADQLVRVGLWETTDGGFRVHDYSDWNRPSESRSEAGRKGAAVRWQKQRNGLANSNRIANASLGHMAQDAHSPIPIPKAAASDTGTHDPPGQDPAAALLDQAFNVLADRRIAASGKPIANVPAYRASVLRALPEDFAALLATVNLDDPEWTPRTLADWLEPPLKKPSDSYTFLRDDIPLCDSCGGTGWTYDDKGDALECVCREVRTA